MQYRCLLKIKCYASICQEELLYTWVLPTARVVTMYTVITTSLIYLKSKKHGTFHDAMDQSSVMRWWSVMDKYMRTYDAKGDLFLWSDVYTIHNNCKST